MKKNRPVIFLDMDGVLCTNRSCAVTTGLMQVLDPCGVQMLKQLIEDYDALLVLSSTWRHHHDKLSMTAILQNAGLSHVPWHSCWKTSDKRKSMHDLSRRGEEIEDWMKTNGYPESYLILDDDRDMLDSQYLWHVKTHPYDGISFANYQEAKNILGRKTSKHDRKEETL